MRKGKRVKIQDIVASSENPLILVDERERKSKVLDFLCRFEVELRSKKLDVGDYICSKRVACERKTIPDFLKSIMDGRIFTQVENLTDSYQNPVLIIEGHPELLFEMKNMHSNAVRGALASITTDYAVPILWTLNPRETASMLFTLAYREQVGKKNGVQIRSAKKPKDLREQQEFLVAGLPNINTKLSISLLKYFKKPKDVFTASVEDLKKVDKIGEKKAKKIWDLLNRNY